MDCILYIDLFFLWNFWMNALILLLVRQLTKTYRTIQCLLAAAAGALTACFGLVCCIISGTTVYLFVVELGGLLLMNIIAFGGKNLLWHLFLHIVTCMLVAGVFLYLIFSV